MINLQCDRDHPTQSLADLLHLRKTFGSVENLRLFVDGYASVPQGNRQHWLTALDEARRAPQSAR